MLKKNLGIYIHVPFCKSKCPYCDFYSLTDCLGKYADSYILSVCSELKKWSKYFKTGIVDTVYFGGGTPSLLGTEKILKIISVIKNNFNLKSGNASEITVEINPADYEKTDFEKLNYNGVNRISLGTQSLNNFGLKVLGRRHSFSDILNSLKVIKKSKIFNISLDVILGAPYQENKDIYDFFYFCKEENIPHISSYLLKIEKGTPYYYNKDNLKFFDDDEYADIYFYACNLAEKFGYKHYEISNFAYKGFESKHNLKYWNLKEYLGIGPSAHSLFNGQRFYYPKDLQKFINSPGIIYESDFEPKKEYVMLKLRTGDGLKNEKFKKKFGMDIPKEYIKKAEKFEKYGFLKIDENSIILNEKGFLISNYIISEII